MLRAGTIVGATIIAAPRSTKNAIGTRDLETKQIRKGKASHFGTKLEIGAGRRRIVHGLVATHAAASDLQQLPHRLHGEARELSGDPAIERRPGRRRSKRKASAVAPTAGHREAGGARARAGASSPGPGRGPVLASSTRYGWSHSCQAFGTRATAASRRTWLGRRRCSHWPTSPPCATGCGRRG
jgi:hypothetical protein